MIRTHVPRVVLTLAALFILLAGPSSAIAQNLTLRTERGCGSAAVYQPGELTRFFFSSSQTVQTILTLRRPDGTSAVLVSAILQGGVTYVTTGQAGAPPGERTLTLTAGSASTTCTYSVLSGPPQGLTLDVRTDRGCGAAAVYQTGETVRITLTSNQTTNAQLTLTRPDGTVSALFNDVLQAGVARVINGVAGGTGVRTLTLSAGTTTATCAFSVGTVTPPPPGPAQRVLGILSSNETQEAVTAPTTAQVGVPFTVTIITSGGGCEEKGDEGVIVADNGATIMVYDLTTATRPGVLCTTIFKQFTHTVNLSFPQPGEKLIQVWGRRTGPGLPAGGVPIVVERRVLVQ